jgi:glycogen(starch) synthase
VYRRADRVVVFSRAHQRELMTAGIRADVEHLGVEPARSGETAGSARRSPDPGARITYAGFLRPAKGIEDLIRAAPFIAAACPGCRIQIVGATAAKDRAYARELQSLASECGAAPFVQFTGDVSTAEFEGIMRQSDLFVFPFRTVSQSITFNEVVALGVPVVASDRGGVGEVVCEHGMGLTCAAGDPAALARAVTSLLRDRAMYETCAARAAAYARLASWPNVAERHIALYHGAVAA